MSKKPSPKKPQKKNRPFNVGDLIKIKPNAIFLQEELLGAHGLILALEKTGYPKGFSGRANDDVMYTVTSQGKSVRLFEDEMEKV